ncbi:MAG: D-alanyl-D-alanine carboxypeptidase [Bacilli bacterium]|nr:D-alanyl-D-alanine carboxypeptidase [Bacilli bacterium]
MNKKILLIIVLILFIPCIVNALDFPNTNSKMVEIYDLNDNKLIYEKKSNKQTSVASLTKIVTSITAIENIKDLDKKVTITNDMMKTVSWEASKAGLKTGDVVTYRDLLYASMLPSGADATNSMAIASTGSIDKFVSKMNALAKKLKLKNTHFVNVTGLDIKGHYSSADDMRIILEYALNNETFKKIYTTRNYTLSNGLKVKSTVSKYVNEVNTSKILGAKTGFTDAAGYCLSSLSNINSHEFIIIVLNAKVENGKHYNLVDTVNLINFLNKNFKNEYLVKKNDLIKTLPVKLSKIDKYEIRATKDVIKYLPSDYNKDDFKIKYTGLKELSFKNKKGKEIGTIKYYYENKLIDKEKVILNKDIKVSFKKLLKKYFYIPLILIVIILFLITRKKKRKNIKKR